MLRPQPRKQTRERAHGTGLHAAHCPYRLVVGGVIVCLWICFGSWCVFASAGPSFVVRSAVYACCMACWIVPCGCRANSTASNASSHEAVLVSTTSPRTRSGTRLVGLTLRIKKSWQA